MAMSAFPIPVCMTCQGFWDLFGMGLLIRGEIEVKDFCDWPRGQRLLYGERDIGPAALIADLDDYRLTLIWIAPWTSPGAIPA